MTSSKFNYFPKAPPPSNSTLEVNRSMSKFVEGAWFGRWQVCSDILVSTHILSSMLGHTVMTIQSTFIRHEK